MGRGVNAKGEFELAKPSRASRPARYRLDAPAPEPSGLIGRGSDLARLRAAFNDACAGQGRIALISGSPGMGKTRIAAELCAIARAQGAVVCQERCFEDAAGMPPFRAFQQAARELMQQQAPDQLPALVGDAASELIKLISELAEAFPDSTAAPQGRLEHARFELFDALGGLLARASAHTPLVIAIDDLQWADEATLAFLECLAPAIANTRIALLLCTQLDAPPSAALERANTAVLRQPGSLLLQLEGLLEHDVAALLRNHGVGDAPGTLVQRITELTSGNPFFITRLARWLLERPAAARGGTALECAHLVGSEPVVLRADATRERDTSHGHKRRAR
jgi:predicted ATPase